MRKLILTSLLFLITGLNLHAQIDTVSWRKGLTLYTDPLYAMRFGYPSGLRVGIIQSLGNDWQAGVQFTLYGIPGKQMKKPRGVSSFIELKRVLPKTITGNSYSWIGLQIGTMNYRYSNLTYVKDAYDSLLYSYKGRYHLHTEHFRIGYGYREVILRNIDIEAGIWLGVRYRDQDIVGFSESQNDQIMQHFDGVASSVFNRKYDLEERITPDLGINLRVCYLIRPR
jgi:hypothetical protein